MWAKDCDVTLRRLNSESARYFQNILYSRRFAHVSMREQNIFKNDLSMKLAMILGMGLNMTLHAIEEIDHIITSQSDSGGMILNPSRQTHLV